VLEDEHRRVRPRSGVPGAGHRRGDRRASPATGLPLGVVADVRKAVIKNVWYMHDVGSGWWLLMSVGMVAFWALVLYGVFLLVRSPASAAAGGPPPESPENVLERRLAAGEISVEEYDRLHRTLGGEPRGTSAPTLTPSG
jgi:putative membrane protein